MLLTDATTTNKDTEKRVEPKKVKRRKRTLKIDYTINLFRISIESKSNSKEQPKNGEWIRWKGDGIYNWILFERSHNETQSSKSYKIIVLLLSGLPIVNVEKRFSLDYTQYQEVTHTKCGATPNTHTGGEVKILYFIKVYTESNLNWMEEQVETTPSPRPRLKHNISWWKSN